MRRATIGKPAQVSLTTQNVHAHFPATHSTRTSRRLLLHPMASAFSDNNNGNTFCLDTPSSATISGQSEAAEAHVMHEFENPYANQHQHQQQHISNTMTTTTAGLTAAMATTSTTTPSSQTTTSCNGENCSPMSAFSTSEQLSTPMNTPLSFQLPATLLPMHDSTTIALFNATAANYGPQLEQIVIGGKQYSVQHGHAYRPQPPQTGVQPNVCPSHRALISAIKSQPQTQQQQNELFVTQDAQGTLGTIESLSNNLNTLNVVGTMSTLNIQKNNNCQCSSGSDCSAGFR